MSNRRKLPGRALKTTKVTTVTGGKMGIGSDGRAYRFTGGTFGGQPMAEPIQPGLQGSYRGTCVICLQPTDTALGFRGGPEWLAAGLMTLGMTDREAIAVYEQGPPRDEMPVRVCRACVRACPADFPDPVPIIDGAELPCIGQPGYAGGDDQ